MLRRDSSLFRTCGSPSPTRSLETRYGMWSEFSATDAGYGTDDVKKM